MFFQLSLTFLLFQHMDFSRDDAPETMRFLQYMEFQRSNALEASLHKWIKEPATTTDRAFKDQFREPPRLPQKCDLIQRTKRAADVLEGQLIYRYTYDTNVPHAPLLAPNQTTNSIPKIEVPNARSAWVQMVVGKLLEVLFVRNNENRPFVDPFFNHS
jgi:hypothetical protein